MLRFAIILLAISTIWIFGFRKDVLTWSEDKVQEEITMAIQNEKLNQSNNIDSSQITQVQLRE